MVKKLLTHNIFWKRVNLQDNMFDLQHNISQVKSSQIYLATPLYLQQ